MSLRTAIRDMLTSGDSSALADVRPDEIAQALTSYADTAALAEADALAPIVTRASHVPFDEDVDGPLGAPLDDVHAELAVLEPIDGVDGVDGREPVDPSDSFDDVRAGNDSPVEPDADSDGPVADGDSGSDPDDAFDAGEQQVTIDSAATVEDDVNHEPEAFGSGDRTPARDDDTSAEQDVRLGNEEPLDAIDSFTEIGLDTDAINETSLDEFVLDADLVDAEALDDGALDDAFGDVDFDV